MSAAARPATPRTRIEEAKARFAIPVLWRLFNLRADPGSPCCSPFREDRSPSFSVYEEGRRWFDNATKEGGDAIDFLAKIRGFSNGEAYLELLNMLDGTIQGPAPAPVQPPEAKPKVRCRTIRPGPKQTEIFAGEQALSPRRRGENDNETG